MAPSTAIALISSSDLWSMGSILYSNENSIAMVIYYHVATQNSLSLVHLLLQTKHPIKEQLNLTTNLDWACLDFPTLHLKAKLFFSNTQSQELGSNPLDYLLAID